MNSKQRCLAAIRGERVDRAPVLPLIMFLAADRLGVPYRDDATNGGVMAEAQLRPRETFGVDAITACSDAFRVSADLGGEMVYPENQTPYLERPLVKSESDFNRLKRPNAASPRRRIADRTMAVEEMVNAAASLISVKMYRESVLPYEQRVCEAVHRAGGLVKLHICGKTAHLLNDMVRSGADLFNVDHLVDLSIAREVYDKTGKCFKGNLNPVTDPLQANPAACEQRAMECLRLVQGSRYMLSAGCEVPAGVSDEVFNVFCRAPEEYSGGRR